MAEVPIKLPFPGLSLKSNRSGWGPSGSTEQYEDMPYQPFSKGDRIGRVADWTGQTYAQDKRMVSKYNTMYTSSGQYAYIQDDDEGAYQLVDTGRGGTRLSRGGRFKIGQRSRGGRNQRGGLNRNDANMRVINPRTGQQQQNNRGNKFGRGGRPRYDNRNNLKNKRDTSASITINSNWKVIEEMDYPRLAKLSLPGVDEGEDLYRAGALEYYDREWDRVTCRKEKRLQRINRSSFTVTTTDDPIIRQLSRTHGRIFATDSIIATIMCSTRSVYSWDIVVERIGDKLFLDKRADSDFDLLTVNETASEPPFADDDPKNLINAPKNLALEATYINHNFSQQVLRSAPDGKRHNLENPIPFSEEGIEPVSVGYRYRKFKLGGGLDLVVRTEVDAVTTGPNNQVQFMNIKGLNEWDPKQSGGIDWRQKLDIQRGAVLANELKNNSCKLAKWTVQSILASADQMKFGFVSRVHSRDSSKHSILGTQQYKPSEFANQINLNMDNAWGILRCIVDTCMKLPEGKYVLLKDPSKPALILYEIPDEDEDDDEDESPSVEMPKEIVP